MPFNKDGLPCGYGGSSKKFKYTYKDMADIVGLEVKTVREYAHKNKFNPNDLLSVARFIIKRI